MFNHFQPFLVLAPKTGLIDPCKTDSVSHLQLYSVLPTDSSVVEDPTHNPKIKGSNPATNRCKCQEVIFTKPSCL
jgi:hypothetical protein